MARADKASKSKKYKIVPRNLGEPAKERPARAKGPKKRDGFHEAAKGAPRKAREQKRRAPSGGSLIEGRRAVEEALDSSVPLLRAFVAASAEHDARLDVLVGRLEGEGVRVESVPRERLDALSSRGSHQGIVAETRPFSYAEVSDIVAAAGEGEALVMVLDHVTDEGNFGAICRSAEIAGAAGLICAKARAAKVGPGAYKTSAGAVMHLPIAQVSNLAAALDELKTAGFWVCAATEHADQSVWDAPLDGRIAIVMGSEGEGISRLLLEKCDFSCALPQRGRIESLNVAQAATVMAYEWLRRSEARRAAGER